MRLGHVALDTRRCGFSLTPTPSGVQRIKSNRPLSLTSGVGRRRDRRPVHSHWEYQSRLSTSHPQSALASTVTRNNDNVHRDVGGHYCRGLRPGPVRPSPAPRHALWSKPRRQTLVRSVFLLIPFRTGKRTDPTQQS